MKNLFDIKRTKMIDELAFEHNPMSFGKTFLAFFILTLISSVATNSVTNAAIMINFIISEIKSGTFKSLTDTLIKFMESPYVSIPWRVILIQLFGGIFANINSTVLLAVPYFVILVMLFFVRGKSISQNLKNFKIAK